MSSSTEAFEYAIKKDVRNNPIVREVDELRWREQWRSVAFGVLFVVVLLFSGWQRVELLQHGYRLEQMQKERGDQEAINRHLRLEIETLKSPQRIERLATSKLRLVTPETGAAIVIERVVPDEPPSASGTGAKRVGRWGPTKRSALRGAGAPGSKRSAGVMV